MSQNLNSGVDKHNFDFKVIVLRKKFDFRIKDFRIQVFGNTLNEQSCDLSEIN